MRAYVDTTTAHPNKDLCFSWNHLKGVFEERFECTDQMDTSLTHYLIADVDLSVDTRVDLIKNLRSQGVKVILMVFDPAAFPRIQRYVSLGMLDKVILFDRQFEKRFAIRTYITDYFFKESLFPRKVATQPNDNVCTFGHLVHGRNNNFNLPRVDEGVGSYKELYSKVQGFNGVAVYDTGLSEDRGSIVTYNKAKAVESLMCGVNAFCKSGISTKRYQRFLKRYDEIPNANKQIEFSQEEIFKINQLTIDELVYEMIYLN